MGIKPYYRSHEYDKSIQVGDLVTGYCKGFFVVDEITPRQIAGEDIEPAFIGRRVFDQNGKIIKDAKLDVWSSSWSKKITFEWIIEETRRDHEKILAKQLALMDFIFGTEKK